MKRWLALVAPLLAVACGEESPTSVGAELLPPDAVRTFEIMLEPHEYMVWDTAFGMYSDAMDAGFVIVADQFEGGMNSHVLARFAISSALTVVDTLGVTRLDTLAAFTGGTVRMLVDTLRSTDAPVRLALYRTAEEWHESATWTHRVDTAGVRLVWSTPGGTRGVLVDTATYAAGMDTVLFRVDSATIAAWRDVDDAGRGAMIVARTADSRIRASSPQLTVEARSSFNPDTVFTASAITTRRTFIYEPEQPEVVSAPRVGGTPAWRTIVRLREGLDTLSFACPGVPGCRFRLSDVVINHAGLMLQPVPPPAGLRPEADLVVGAYTLLTTPLVPLQRSPLGELVGVATIPHTSFMAPDAPIAEVAVTDLIRRLTMRPEQLGDAPRPTHFILTPGLEPRLFGFATFESMPRLRLVVSIAQELQLP